MIEFIPADELKYNFGVFGHFYSVQVAPKRVVECRSVLEIVKSDHVPKKTAALFNRKSDAVFIMMNPGSTGPLTEVDNRISADAIHGLPNSLVPTEPDTTQFQVMRVKHYCKWRHLRVLNLSDLRCSKSVEFFKQLESASFDSHSIFSVRRKNELVSKLTNHRPIPMVRAWGVSGELDPLIERCLSKISNHPTTRGLVTREQRITSFIHCLRHIRKSCCGSIKGRAVPGVGDVECLREASLRFCVLLYDC